jgi:pyruvate dehydrogenase E1 component alpha subunit
VCENNKYGMSFSTEKSMAVETVAERSGGYGLPGVTVDGNDVEAVHEAVTTAVDRARAGEGPTLVEALTYRWKGHSKSDKNLYRTREEISEWRDKDPIGRFEAVVVERGVLTAADVEEVRAAATNDVRAAARRANAAPDANPDDLLDAVFATA